MVTESAQHAIRPTLARAIEDAIILGNIGEIDAVLSQIGDDDYFPQALRAGLEALRHFRAHYGKDSASPPRDDIQKKKMALMESAWGAELLEMLRQVEGKVAKRA